MKTNKIIILISVLFLNTGSIFPQPSPRNIKTSEYRALQESLCAGWNSWYNNNVLSQVLLPEGFSLNICFSTPGQGDYLRTMGPTQATMGLRSDNGAYISMVVKYKNINYEIQTASDGSDEYILITPEKTSKNQLVLEAGLLYGVNGGIEVQNDKLLGKFSKRTIVVNSTETPIKDAYVVTSSPHLTVPLKKEIAVYTGSSKTLNEIKEFIVKNRDIQQKRVDEYGKMAEPFKAMQTILAWNTIYDAANHRAIAPVNRSWSQSAGGFVMFDWDTYFAGYMFSLFNKELAYANVVEITKAITPDGFIPNYCAPFKHVSWDRSQPPVGSLVILSIYNRYKEKWLLDEVYDELLTWNRWWPENRNNQGYLSWGSNPVPDSLRTISKNDLQAALYESGLDNSPMYDDMSFTKERNIMELADVGLMSFYIADCKALASISEILGKKTEAKELKYRANQYTKKLATLWNIEKGIFLNKRTDNGEWSYRLSPTNFYPLLAKACTQKQAEEMIEKHYFNTNEFYGQYVIPSISRNDPAYKDDDYWRGRIWAPMNFLVYLGIKNYDLPEARKDIVEKSLNLMMKGWNDKNSVFENYQADTGEGASTSFYHWGALLGFISFIEDGYMNELKK